MRNFFLVIIAIILLGPTAARAHDVLVFQGLRVKPYDEAFRGLKSVCDADMRRFYVSDLEGKDLLRIVREERPRLLVAIGANALAEAQKTRGIPIVYLMMLPPQSGIAGSRNITGVSMTLPPERYFDLLVRISPSPKKIGIVYDPAKTGHLVKRAQQAARARGMELVVREVSRPNEVPTALNTLKGMVDALLMLPDTTVVTPETVEFYLLFSQNNNIPVMSFAAKYVDMGALLSLDIDGYDQGKQAGEMARKILGGTAVADLPRAEARKANLRTNRSVASKLDISLDSIDQ